MVLWCTHGTPVHTFTSCRGASVLNLKLLTSVILRKACENNGNLKLEGDM